ncbi:hypothetical protein qu_495 [Acanthamoeba polyphaga mimivirus]|nr:hypothetical protein [Mimivirus reunion]WMV61830.1 hypothetical protein qu_495 [Mimivirus sp.]WMV62807.1 hypothetical protein qu_495 [Acanthamoeba polyphaga mimivirus]WMV63784.1 hypothetical protein qu_495 [Mimivirus sp.]
MYVNQIDDIIDGILNKLYFEGLSNDESFNSIVNSNKINFVEYREQINKFIDDFVKSIDLTEIRKIINNKDNLNRIIDIIKRYVAYYYFLSIAYNYTGSLKDFRNNMIQYSKLQESSTFIIRNFFDTENNYQLIKYFKIIKDTSKILLMTDLQRKTLNPLDVKDTIDFLNGLGKEYINNYLLMITVVDNEDTVNINPHNLIKTIVFGELYKNQERNLVFEILNEIEEDKEEYTYIDIVVSSDETNDLNNFRQIFLGEDDAEARARDLFELANETNRVTTIETVETKNNDLIALKIITPIVDDFLRYHRDTERLDAESGPVNIPIVSNNNSKNVQLALLYQQRKKKENTRAQLVINKLDAILDYYSPNVKNNPEFISEIKKYFQNPLSYRKAVLHNYLDEVNVIDKIRKQGKKAMENNEYFLELMQIITHAYFNFKDFKNFGTSINLFNTKPVNMLRYSNIEFQNQMSSLEVDVHTGIEGQSVNLVGLAIGPFNDEPVSCTKKSDLLDIRKIQITYMKNDQPVTRSTDNGYKAFLKIIKHFYINTLEIREEPEFSIYNNFDDIRKLNPDIFGKMIYWTYNTELDTFEMDTYENIKSNSVQDIIRFMNAMIYDKIMDFLDKKLVLLIETHTNLSLSKIESLIQIFSNMNQLSIDQEERRDLVISNFLQKKSQETTIVPKKNLEIIPLPEYQPLNLKKPFVIGISMINPLNPQPYIKLEAYSRTTKDRGIIQATHGKCKHESEWNEINKVKNQNLNKYNSLVTAFIEKYHLETTQLDYVCKVCGQILPLKRYVQDGSFNNNTQQFVTAYVPIDIPLEEIKEYRKYVLAIRYIDALINRVSLITNTNMLVGTNTNVRQRRKGLVKNIIDIILKHNSVNMRKNISDVERSEYLAKKYNINKDLNEVYFFELDDSIFNFTPTASNTEITLNKLKFNNILLYFILIFITELNGPQITMMATDKIAGNIYVFLKYGQKLFGDLLIKTNINSNETAPITQYPVLCYLLYLLSYYLVKYKLWYQPGENTKVYNPYYSKVIINSFVDLFNGISSDAGRITDDYVYKLTVSKMYTQLNTTYRNNEIINILRRNQSKYDTRSSGIDTTQVTTENEIPTYPIANPINIPVKPRAIPDFKKSSGIIFDREDKILYPIQLTNTDITNCPIGSYHAWVSDGHDIRCTICGEKGSEVTGSVIRLDANYYYSLNNIANRRCIRGTLHDFIDKNGKLVCSICGHTPNETYDKPDLDKLMDNINKIDDQNAENLLRNIHNQQIKYENQQKVVEDFIREIKTDYAKDSNNKLYGRLGPICDKLITIFETYLGSNVNLDIDKYPVYLRNNIYIIDHSYNGTPLDKPVIFSQNENRILFRENHQFFKTDVYYYTDNRLQIDVFYHAVTLKLLGYKEKHKEYTRVAKTNSYLKINYSIMERLLMLGYKTKYIDIEDNFVRNSSCIKDVNTNYFQIIDNLIKDHINKIKKIIDKFSSTIYKIKNYQNQLNEEQEPIYLQSSQVIDKLISKYFNIIKIFNIGEDDKAFDNWNYLRTNFEYQEINWLDTNVRPSENMYVNSELVNYYDISSSEMMYYLVDQLISIIDSNPEKITRSNLCQMMVEIIMYIYNIYNIDEYKNILEFKRFDYIINGSSVMVDMLRRGQGLEQSKELEQHLDDTEPDIMQDMDGEPQEADELEDLKEEAESLDIEGDYFAEEDEDYAQEDFIE